MSAGPGELDPEDAKLVTLARAARGRAYVPAGARPEGAAVRDTDGRTYAGATVSPGESDLGVSALRAAVTAAAGSGARRFEAAVLVTTAGAVDAPDLAFLGEFGAGVPVLVADPDGAVVARATSG
jgi:cytidine deaminase